MPPLRQPGCHVGRVRGDADRSPDNVYLLANPRRKFSGHWGPRVRIRPELEFSRILRLGRIGETGETYALNRNGLMVSTSRFDNELILAGILPDVDRSRSILNVQLRDPDRTC